MRRRNSQGRSGPFADLAPTLDANEPGDLRLLRQRVQLLERPRVLVLDQAVDNQLVGILVDVGRRLLWIIGVETERARDCAFRIGRRQPVRIEQPGLYPVIEVRHDTQRLFSRRAIDDVAARQQDEAPETRTAQKHPARRVGQQLCGILDKEATINARNTRFRLEHGLPSAAEDHGAQAPRHQQRHDDMNDEE